MHAHICIGQIKASTPPPLPSPGIPRAFDTFAVLGRREFDYHSLPGVGKFYPHAKGGEFESYPRFHVKSLGAFHCMW